MTAPLSGVAVTRVEYVSTNVVMRLKCPHCLHCFLEAVSLIRPGASAYCPLCVRLFVLDPDIEAIGRLLQEAKAARRERKRRRQELQASWREVPAPLVPAAPALPMLAEVLARLDALLERMEDDFATDLTKAA